MHTRLADESVCIGPPSPRESYLNIPAIIAAGAITNANAIHPGYGFLSESPDFAAIVEEHGFVFIGPSPAHITLMGDKIRAKQTAAALGLPVVPGSARGAGGCRRLRPGRGRDRLSGSHQGGGGRRRTRDEAGRPPRGAGRRRRHRTRRGRGPPSPTTRSIWRSSSPRAAPYRGAGARRYVRQRGASRRARLLASAPPPEGAGGGAVAGAGRAPARRDRRPREHRGARARLSRGRHAGIPL